MNAPTPVLLLALLAAPAYAHHSFAPHFDIDKPVDISGKVTEYEARNPHSYLHIAAVDENGKTQEYVCESHGVTQLTGFRSEVGALQVRTRRVDRYDRQVAQNA